MTDEELKAISDRAAAAIPGPWVWRISLKSKEVHLEAQISGLEFVMGFRRWGMGGATVEFQKKYPEGYSLMCPAKDFAQVIPKREHHKDWCQTLSQPEADFIAHAREDVPALIEEVRRLHLEDDKLRKTLKKIATLPIAPSEGNAATRWMQVEAGAILKESEKQNHENAVCMNCIRDDRSCDEHGKPIGESR